LIDAVNILKSTYRESDIIARIGGDEFVVFPAGNNESNLNKIIDRLQANIDIYNAAKKRGYTLSMSVGVSVYDPKKPRSTDDLLAEADRFMYENKRQKKMV
jgi:diguanylate cyclase (GGDEF)-like protein